MFYFFGTFYENIIVGGERRPRQWPRRQKMERWNPDSFEFFNLIKLLIMTKHSICMHNKWFWCRNFDFCYINIIRSCSAMTGPPKKQHIFWSCGKQWLSKPAANACLVTSRETSLIHQNKLISKHQDYARYCIFVS